MRDHKEGVLCLLHVEGKTIATGSKDDTIKIWNYMVIYIISLFILIDWVTLENFHRPQGSSAKSFPIRQLKHNKWIRG